MTSYQVDPAAAPPRRLGRYELIGQLATGGMAEIHLARLAGEAGFEKIVVVKRLLPELVASPAYVAMFLDEGKLVSRLDHPNICEVFELGRDGAEYYLAMPFLDGIAVHELIARPRDPDRISQLRVATGVIVQACAGLHHAHELRDADGAPAGLVHRDVSPSNLFVTSAGIVKVLDFGVAKVRGAAETEVGTIKGKQQYMAPEQLLGEPLDRRCDVFALGIVLFELATHQRLFKRASDYLAARAVLEEPIQRADAVDPAVPAALAGVIARALSREADARHADAAALGKAVEAVMAAHGGIASASEIAAAVTSTDELSAMRTRQARVLGDARSREGSQVATTVRDEIAPTRPLRNTAPPAAAASSVTSPVTVAFVARTPRRATAALRVLAIGFAALIVLSGVLVYAYIARSDDPIEATADPHGSGAAGDPASALPAPAASRAAAASEATARSEGLDRSGIGPGSGGSSQPAAPEVEPPPDPIEMPRERVRVRPKKGQLSIDSKPYATIYVDGVSLGVTPILRRTLPAGRHKLRAVLKDGRSKEMSINVPANALAKPIVLTW